MNTFSIWISSRMLCKDLEANTAYNIFDALRYLSGIYKEPLYLVWDETGEIIAEQESPEN